MWDAMLLMWIHFNKHLFGHIFRDFIRAFTDVGICIRLMQSTNILPCAMSYLISLYIYIYIYLLTNVAHLSKSTSMPQRINQNHIPWKEIMSTTTLMDGCWAMLTWHRLIQFTMRLFWGPQIPFPHWEMKICIGSWHEGISGIWGFWYRKQVSQACISNCIPQNNMGCNYLCMPEMPTPGAELISGIWGLWDQKQISQACIINCIPQNNVGCNYLCMPEITASWCQTPHI